MNLNSGTGISPYAYVGFALLLWGAFWVMRRMRQIPPAQAHQWVERGAMLLDVRTEREFAAGHIAGAKNVPLPVLHRERESLGDANSAIVVYCASGMRSSLAMAVLKRLGFTKVADLGPMSRW